MPKSRRPTSTKACKAKSRRLQDDTRDGLRALAKSLKLNLQEDDICSREMGQPGTDVRLSPAARAALGELFIECKNTERFNAMQVYNKHCQTYKNKAGLKLVVHTRNGRGSVAQPRLVLLSLQDFLSLLEQSIVLKRLDAEDGAAYQPTNYFDSEGQVVKTI